MFLCSQLRLVIAPLETFSFLSYYKLLNGRECYLHNKIGNGSILLTQSRYLEMKAFVHICKTFLEDIIGDTSNGPMNL